MDNMQQLLAGLETAKADLNQHSIYEDLVSLNSVRSFMKYHVYAVWDFMNLLTALQTMHTTTTVPWQPPSAPKLAYLVNAIKLEEESDCIDGQYTSHFQFYRQSMGDLGVDEGPIARFLEAVTVNYAQALAEAPVPVQAFLRHTYQCIQAGPVAVAASFAFGRETIIPAMFSRILAQLPDTGPHERFKLYLDRHIELDGDEHGALAQDLVAKTCGESQPAWEQATQWALSAIQARIALYSAIQNAV
tara:strand:- start:1175 stop:1912 length:738 start_codon:yes stop_codon:yes gene_type:complete